jgi:hypothetical protein
MFEQYKWILKCCWKIEKVKVQRCWRNEFGTPTPITITRLYDKFETDGTMQNVNKGQCGRPRNSTNNESVVTVTQTTLSPEESVRQCSH